MYYIYALIEIKIEMLNFDLCKLSLPYDIKLYDL